MPSLKDIKRRIVSVKKTRQITQAMKLVAAAKLKRATEAAVSAKPYQRQLAQVLARVAQKAGDQASHPLLEAREQPKNVLVVVLTSDRGLCGAFNNTLLRRTLDWLSERKSAGMNVTIRVYGRKGATFLPKRGWRTEKAIVDWSARQKMELVSEVVDEMVAGFVDGQYDEVWLASNELVSTLVQKPRFSKILPLVVDPAQLEAAAGPASDTLEYRYEPSAPEIIGALLPLYIRTLVLQALLETIAGEFAARMTAMDSATRNAGDLIDGLTIVYNRARQAAITREIIEIVSGAEAL